MYCNKTILTTFSLILQVLQSIQCVLVTPKRKLAGRLAVMKNVLHFFGEFLVEGTGGASVFKDFHGSSGLGPNKPDQKQKFLNCPEYLDFCSEMGQPSDSAESENLQQKQLKHIKRHRRWNVSKVGHCIITNLA